MNKKKLKKSIPALSLLLVGSSLHAQVALKGKILDVNGQSIPDVSVKAVGGNQQLQNITDKNGEFILSNLDSSKAYAIMFNAVGYKKDTIYNFVPDSKNNLLLYRLVNIASQLDEVVVTGQGAAVSKRRLPNNVVSVSSAELEKVAGQRIDQMLSAKLPNAQLNISGGQAGATSIVKARGMSSAFLNSSPIIYIDGVRMDNLNTPAMLGGSSQGASMSSFADIPTDNIDHIEYINGGAATTLYGSDAANGVIQIFTKKSGQIGTHLSLATQTGLVAPTTDYLYFKRTKDLLLKNGVSQKYNLALNGSSGNGFGYNVSASYYDNTGVQIQNQNRNRILNISSGFTAKLNKVLSYESSFMFVYNHYKRNRNGNQGGYTGLWFAEDGASKITGPGFKNRIDDLSPAAFDSMKVYVNNAERLQNNNIATNRFTTSQTLKYRPMDNLNFKLTTGIDYRSLSQSVIETNEYLSAIKGADITNQGSISNFDRTYTGITVELNGQHKYRLGKFSFISTVGGQLFRTKDHQVTYTGTNIRDGAYTIGNASVKTANEALLEVLNYGIYAQENIGFDNNVFLDLGVRGDRNPSFGKNIGTQYYPKAGLSYVMSSAQWFHVPFINLLRWRASYGVAGNLPPAYANEKTIAFNGFNNNQSAGFGQQGNPNLKPEKTTTIEGGFDISFFQDLINLTVTAYNTQTRDALFYVTPAPSTGYTTQLRNVGKIQNKGFEFNATWNVLRKEDYALSFNTSLNTVKNKVVDAAGAPPFNLNGFSSRTVQTVVEQGHPVGYIRGSRGHFNADGLLDGYDALQDLGTTIPTLYGNLGFNFRYKKLSIFSNANYQKGAYAVNWDAQFRYYYGASDKYVPAAESKADTKRLNWLNMTNLFVQKTDFLKVRNIGATYDVITNSKKAIKYLGFTFSAVNPFNFHAGDFDPETTISGGAQGQGSASTGGVVYATYSAPREFIFSIKANF